MILKAHRVNFKVDKLREFKKKCFQAHKKFFNLFEIRIYRFDSRNVASFLEIVGLCLEELLNLTNNWSNIRKAHVKTLSSKSQFDPTQHTQPLGVGRFRPSARFTSKKYRI